MSYSVRKETSLTSSEPTAFGNLILQSHMGREIFQGNIADLCLPVPIIH